MMLYVRLNLPVPSTGFGCGDKIKAVHIPDTLLACLGVCAVPSDLFHLSLYIQIDLQIDKI